MIMKKELLRRYVSEMLIAFMLGSMTPVPQLQLLASELVEASRGGGSSSP